MKGLLKFLLGTGLSLQAMVAAADNETVVSTRTVELNVDLSRTKVVSSNAGYGAFYRVKVLVPELAAPTLMNHRNAGESAPCLATYETNLVDDVLKGKPETIRATFKIELRKSTMAVGGVCRVYLTEDVSTEIRGYNFIHSRTEELPERVLDDCQ